MTILNGARIRAIRLERGLSQRAVARRLGVTVVVVNGIEEGRNHPELMLRLVHELADVLGLEPGELFTSSADADTPEAAGDDVRKLGAVFANERTGIHRDEIARTLDWQLNRVRRASDELQQHLAEIGMRLDRGCTGWKLRPDLTALNWEDEIKLARARQRVRGLLPREAVLLRAALDAPLNWQWEKNLGNADRVALGGLLKTGLLVKTEEGFVLSDQVERSMRGWRRPTATSSEARTPL